MSLRVISVALVLFAFGCPREVQTPEPGEATPCETVEDCNGGQSCADYPLRLCVDGLCEQVPALVRPCVDGG